MGFMVCPIMCVGRWGSWSVPLCVLGDGVHGLTHYVCWEMGFMVCPIMCVGRWGSWSDPLCVLGDGVHGLSHYVCWEMGFMVWPIMCVGRWGSWSVPLCVLGDGVHGLSHYVCWEMGFMVWPIMCVGRWGSWSVPLCVLGDGVHGLTHYVCWEMGFMVCPIMCVGRWGSWSVPLCVLGDGVHGLCHYVCWEMGFMVCPIMCVGRWGSWSVPLCVLGDGVHGLCHYVCRRSESWGSSWGTWCSTWRPRTNWPPLRMFLRKKFRMDRWSWVLQLLRRLVARKGARNVDKMEFLKKKHRDSKLFQSYSYLFFNVCTAFYPNVLALKRLVTSCRTWLFFCHQKSNGNVKLGGGGGDSGEGWVGTGRMGVVEIKKVTPSTRWMFLHNHLGFPFLFVLLSCHIYFNNNFYLFIYFIFPVFLVCVTGVQWSSAILVIRGSQVRSLAGSAG